MMIILEHLRRVVLVGVLVSLLGVSAAFAAKASSTGYPRLMQGPMVGAVTDTDARIWVRTSGAFNVAVVYDVTPDFTSPTQTEPVMVEKVDDYTAMITSPISNRPPSTSTSSGSMESGTAISRSSSPSASTPLRRRANPKICGSPSVPAPSGRTTASSRSGRGWFTTSPTSSSGSATTSTPTPSIPTSCARSTDVSARSRVCNR